MPGFNASNRRKKRAAKKSKSQGHQPPPIVEEVSEEVPEQDHRSDNPEPITSEGHPDVYGMFPDTMINTAVMCVMKMGGNVNWESVAKCLRINAARLNACRDGQQPTQSGSQDSEIPDMESTMRELFQSLMTWEND